MGEPGFSQFFENFCQYFSFSSEVFRSLASVFYGIQPFSVFMMFWDMFPPGPSRISMSLTQFFQSPTRILGACRAFSLKRQTFWIAQECLTFDEIWWNSPVLSRSLAWFFCGRRNLSDSVKNYSVRKDFFDSGEKFWNPPRFLVSRTDSFGYLSHFWIQLDF